MPRKTVAIRGLDTDLYTEVFAMAKKDGRRVSDVVNSALKAFIDNGSERPRGSGVYAGRFESDGFVLSIDIDGDVSLSKGDIKDISEDVGVFSIVNSGTLTFEKDVDKDALKGIDRIVINSGTIRVPRRLYAQFLMISQISGKIEKY